MRAADHVTIPRLEEYYTGGPIVGCGDDFPAVKPVADEGLAAPERPATRP